MRKILGYSLLVISCIALALMLVVPFLDLAAEERAAWMVGLFVFAEITWWLAMPLLGKEVLAFCQRVWQRFKVRLGPIHW